MTEISRQELFTGTMAVSERHRIDEKSLEAFMAANVEGFEGPIDVKEFKGGQSNPTYKISAPGRSYVLRRKPPGKLLPSAHAVDREFRVISSLNKVGFPVPTAYVLCEDEKIVGTPFYIMEFVEGRVIWDPLIPGETPENRRAIYDSQAETLARLHKVDYEAIGLGDYGKPGNYVARQIARWGKQYVASETEEIVEMNKLMTWLPENIPEDETVSLVHGDFHLDNTIVHPTEPRIVAVLDWEISTLGDPLADFTYHLMQWRTPGNALCETSDEELKELGVMTEDEYTAAYCLHSGRDRIDNLEFYTAFNFFKLACILQGIRGRVRDGTASSDHAAEMSENVRPLAGLSWKFAQAAGAR